MPSLLKTWVKKCLAAMLSYGFIFSYPVWTVFTRIADADPIEAEGTPVVNEDTPPPNVPVEPASGVTAGVTAGTRRTPGDPADPSGDAGKSKRKKHNTGDDLGGSGDDGKKKATLPADSLNCNEDKFYHLHTHGKPVIGSSPMCGEGEVKQNTLVENCWKQVFTLLGAANANAYYLNNPESDHPDQGHDYKKSAGSSTAPGIIDQMNKFVPSVGKKFQNEDTEDTFAKSLDEMSNKDFIKEGDHRQCCLQLVEKAREIGNFIKTHKQPKGGELDLKPKQEGDFNKLFASQQDKCEGHGGGAVVAAVVKPPEKKKNKWLIGILIALLIGGILFALLQKKKGKHPKKKKPPKKKCTKDCGGSTTTSTSGSPTTTVTGTPTTTTTGTPTTTTTGNTYPSTTGDTAGRTTATVTGTATGVVTSGDGPGRGNSTGANGTVSGATNATTGTVDTGGAVTGNTYVDAGDGPPRTTAGTPRSPIAPSAGRSLIQTEKK